MALAVIYFILVCFYLVIDGTKYMHFDHAQDEGVTIEGDSWKRWIL